MHRFFSPQEKSQAVRRTIACSRYLIAGMLLGLLAAACTPTQLPPITVAPTEHRQAGQVVWHDLLTDDVAAAREFYGQLFGWTFQEHNGYTLVLNDNMPIAGMVERTTAGKKSGCWVVCLSIEDVDDRVRMVEEAGGTILRQPAAMNYRGRYTIVSDPQGAPLVLLHSASGDPLPAEPGMGGWLWDELWTTDTEAALAFYQSLGDYDALRVNPEESISYWILMNGEQWQAGITDIPFEGAQPQWVPVVRVADPAAAADRARSLGGRVLVKPDDFPGNGSVALIEDPTGGIVMVQTWQPDVSSGKEQEQ